MKNNVHWGNYFFSQMAGLANNIVLQKFNNYSLNQNKITSSLELSGSTTYNIFNNLEERQGCCLKCNAIIKSIMEYYKRNCLTLIKMDVVYANHHS